MRVLVLGGTAEARELAGVLYGRAGVEVTTSLAGRVSRPALPPGRVRTGGFGGVDGLARYLRAERVDALVDATHPFAATISAHAAEAAAAAQVRLLALRRPGWTEGPCDRWIRVPDVTAAAARIAALPGGCVFVTTGRRDLAAYAGDGGHTYLIRTVEPPDGPLPPKHSLVLDRGPYTPDGESGLMRAYEVTALVTKDSGGPLTVAKLVAARGRGIPVVMVDRPSSPRGVDIVSTVDGALTLLDSVSE